MHRVERQPVAPKAGGRARPAPTATPPRGRPAAAAGTERGSGAPAAGEVAEISSFNRTGEGKRRGRAPQAPKAAAGDDKRQTGGRHSIAVSAEDLFSRLQRLAEEQGDGSVAPAGGGPEAGATARPTSVPSINIHGMHLPAASPLRPAASPPDEGDPFGCAGNAARHRDPLQGDHLPGMPQRAAPRRAPPPRPPAVSIQRPAMLPSGGSSAGAIGRGTVSAGLGSTMNRLEAAQEGTERRLLRLEQRLRQIRCAGPLPEPCPRYIGRAPTLTHTRIRTRTSTRTHGVTVTGATWTCTGGLMTWTLGRSRRGCSAS